MIILNEACGSAVPVKNTGGKKQCPAGQVRTYALAKKTFSFTNAADAKLEASWDAAKASKDIVMFYDIDVDPEANNTEAVINAALYTDYKIKDAVKGVNYTHFLATCSYEALKSYENNPDYTTVFRITSKNELLCEIQDDETVKGLPLTSFLVGIHNDAIADVPENAIVGMKFADHSQSVLQPAFDLDQYEGIFDVDLQIQGTPTATEIIVKAVDDCTDSLVVSFEQADWAFTGGTISGSVYSSITGFYTLSGTGLTTGILTTVVVTYSGITYEGLPANVTI